jgi:hypothetical protein
MEPKLRRTAYSRIFKGDFNLSLNELREKIIKQMPDVSPDVIEILIRRKRNFDKKHLKAYLRGDKTFTFGFDNLHRPVKYNVLSKYFKKQ